LRLTRRSVFAGTASLAATALAPGALALPTQSQPELTALGAKFEQALAAYRAAQARFNACEERFLAECADPPEALTPAGPLGNWLKHDWMYWSARDLRAVLRDPERKGDWAAAQDVLRIALAYEARERRLARRVGLRAAERAYREAGDAVENLSERIFAAPAPSAAALAVQGRIVKFWGKPEWWSADDGHADACERFAARIIEGLIAAAASA
jgi:multidrug efflux pump subunit AcrA (membrane-fusion protein)